MIGFAQWIPDEHISDPVRSRRMGLPTDLTFRTKGQLAIDIAATAATDGFRPDFYCGDEVYGNCTELRTHFETNAQAYVLRVQRNFRITLPNGAVTSCDQAVKTLLQGHKHKRRWEIRSAGKGSKGDRWYAWAWIATTSPRHYLLIRKHLRTGELAFHYCFVPEGQLLTKARLIRAAGLRWPVEEGLCATRRSAVFPVQPGGTWREVSGSDGLPGAERLRGQEHARKSATGLRRLGRCVEGPA